MAPIFAALYLGMTQTSSSDLSEARGERSLVEDDMSTDDRRAPGATRIPFEALVEVGGELGPSFEAQAIDVSEDGMHLRTAYLPDLGQPLSCRFDAGPGGSVIATGTVVWKQEAAKGGEFGIRFADLDPQSAAAMKQMMGIDQAPIPPAKGNRIRLHIEGLGSPMRAHVKDSGGGRLTAFSGLGFLQVGKHLELEDTTTGTKRPAHVVRVECELDPASHVPQLVMSFQYEDEEGQDEAPAKESTPEPMVTQDELAPTAQPARNDEDDLNERASAMKGFVARTASKVTPAFERLLDRARTTAALLAAKRGKGSGDDVAIPLRRRTAPPPQGGLHASGRKVVRDATGTTKESLVDSLPRSTNAKKLAIGAGLAGALLVGAVALHKPSTQAVGANGDAVVQPATPLTPTTAESPLNAPPSVLSPVTPTSPPMGASAGFGATGATEVPSNDVLDEGSDAHAHRHAKVAPFSNGAVAHGNVLRIKMDGDIEKIEGDGQPTGFTVVIPGRRSLEPAAPLAARDSRIASIRVTNDGGGAELTMAFKDGVPNYLVRAKGDVLEIVLAPAGSLSEANKPVRVTTAPSRHHHRHHEKSQ